MKLLHSELVSEEARTWCRTCNDDLTLTYIYVYATCILIGANHLETNYIIKVNEKLTTELCIYIRVVDRYNYK